MLFSISGKEAPTRPERVCPPERAYKNINTQTGNLLKDPWSNLCYIRHVVITEETTISIIYPLPNFLQDAFPHDYGYEQTDLMISQGNPYYYFDLLLIKTFGVAFWDPI